MADRGGGGERLVEFMAVKVIGAFLPLCEYPALTVRAVGLTPQALEPLPGWVQILASSLTSIILHFFLAKWVFSSKVMA